MSAGEYSIPSRVRAREALRSAQADAKRATAAAEAATQVAQRAGAAADRQHQAVEGHAGLGDRMLSWAAGVFTSGGEPGELPPDLAAERNEQTEAGRRWETARAVHGKLATQAHDLAVEAEQARADLRAAADCVMQESALALIDRVHQADAEAARLRVLASALGGTRTLSDKPLPWAIQQLAHDPVHAPLIDLAPPGSMPAASAAWSAYRAALLTDPNAPAPM